jgi:hypothetical protein
VSGAGRQEEVTDAPRWWELRRAQNLKPATYSCPLCGRNLASMSEHVLLFPEGDHSQRRHAHTDCVRRAREAGRLPSRSEWRRSQPAGPSLFGRLRARMRRL